jgi:hypothetical protein
MQQWLGLCVFMKWDGKGRLCPKIVAAILHLKSILRVSKILTKIGLLGLDLLQPETYMSRGLYPGVV